MGTKHDKAALANLPHAYELTTIADLKPAAYNPRSIDEATKQGLGISLKKFGDLSQITWNKRSGVLVGGHQRMDQLKTQYGDKLQLHVDGDRAMLITPEGNEFPVRIVDWDEMTERAANLAANNPALQGQFTKDAEAIVKAIENEDPAIAEALRLGEIEAANLVQVGAEAKEETEATGGPPEMELQPFEHYDYVVLLATSTQDWEFILDRLGLERVNASPIPGKKKIGLGRAINANKLVSLIQKFEDEVATLRAAKK